MGFKIKKISDFIKEGAYIDANNNIVVSKKNHPGEESEKLKTSDLRVSGLNIRSGNIEVYYGLYPIGEDNDDIIPEQNWIKGKDVNGKEIVLNTIKSRYMDSLKSGNFKMDSGETLGDFISSDIKRKFPSGLDYIVTIESSKSLVPLMGEELKMIYPNATLIQLPKKIYSHPSEVFDLITAEERSKGEEKGMSIVKAKKALAGEISDWEKLSPEEKAKGYKVSTSNKIEGSVRPFMAPKYDLKNKTLVDAIYDCIVKSKNRENDNFNETKKMVILDDNTNSGLDFIEIAKGIQKFIDEEIKPLIGNVPEYQISPIKESILGYVFYTMKKPETVNIMNPSKLKTSRVKKYENDIKFYYNTYRKMYQERGIEGKELTRKSINSTINELIRRHGISVTADEIAQVLGLRVY